MAGFNAWVDLGYGSSSVQLRNKMPALECEALDGSSGPL